MVNLNSRVLDPAGVQEHPESEVHRVWLLHCIDYEPREVHCTPAVNHAEVLTWYPLAVPAESIEASTECTDPATDEHETATLFVPVTARRSVDP